MNSGKDSDESDSSATIQKESPVGTKQLSTQLKVREDVVDSGKGSDESDNTASIQDKSPVESQLPPSQVEVVEDFVDSGKGSSESDTSVAPNTSSSSDDGNNKSDVSCSLTSTPIRDGSLVEDQNKSVDIANKSVKLRTNTSDRAENELERVMTSMLKKRRSAQWTKLVSLDNTLETTSPEPDTQNVVAPTSQVLPKPHIVDESSDFQLVEDSTTEDVQVEKEESVESSGQVNTGNNSTLSEPKNPSFASFAAEVQAVPQMEIEAEEPNQMKHVEESTTPVAAVAMDVSDKLHESIFKDNNSTTSEPESTTVATLESDHELDIHIQLINDLIAEVEQEKLSNSINAEDVPSTAMSESEDSANPSLPTSVQLDESAEHQLDSRQTSPVVEEEPAALSQVTTHHVQQDEPCTRVLQPVASHDNSTSSDQLKALPKASLCCKMAGAASKSKKRVQKKNQTKLDAKMYLEMELLPIPRLTEAEQDHIAAVTRDKLCLAFLNMFHVDKCPGLVQKFDVLDNLHTFCKLNLYTETRASFDMERFVSSRVDFSKKNHKNGVIAIYRSLRQLIVNRMTFDEIAMATLCYLFTKKNKPDVLKAIETRLYDQIQEISFDYLQGKLDKYLMTEKSVSTPESTNKGDTSHSAEVQTASELVSAPEPAEFRKYGVNSSAPIEEDSPVKAQRLSTQLEVREDVVDSGKSSDESDIFAPIRDESPVENHRPPSQLEVVEDFVISGKGSSESETSVARNTSSSSDDGNNKLDVFSSLESNSSAPIQNDSTVENQNKSVDIANKSVKLRANTSDGAKSELERVMTSMLKKRRSAQWTKLVSLDNTSGTTSPEPDSQDVVEPTTQVLPQSDIVDKSSDSQLVEDSTTENVQVEKDASDESSGQVNTGNDSTLSEPEYPSCASLAAEVRAAPQMEIEAEKPFQMEHVEESTTPVAQVAMDVSDELHESICKDNNSTASEPESKTIATRQSDHELDIHIQLITDSIAKVEQDSTEVLSNSINAEDDPSTATSESEDSANASLPSSVQLDESAEHQLDETSPVVEEKAVSAMFSTLESTRQWMLKTMSARWTELMRKNKMATGDCTPEMAKTLPTPRSLCKMAGAASKFKKRVQKKKQTELDAKMSLERELLPIPILTEAEQDHLAAMTRDKVCLAFLNMFHVDECTGSVQKFDVLDNLQTFCKSTLYTKTRASFDMERFVSSRVDFSKKNHKNGVIAIYRSLRQLIVNRMTFDEIAMATL